MSLNDRGRTEPSDAETFAYGGLIVGVLCLLSLYGRKADGDWESHATATRQWLAIGILFFPYAAVSALPARYSERFRSVLMRFVRAAVAATRSKTVRVLAKIAFFVIFPVSLIWSIFRAPPIVNTLLQWLAIIVLFAWLLFDKQRGRLATLWQGLRFFTSEFGLRIDVWRTLKTIARGIFIIALLVWTAWLLCKWNRHLALPIGVLQAVVIIRLLPRTKISVATRFTIFSASIIAWTFAATLTFTPLADYLSGPTRMTALGAVAFCAAFALVLAELVSAGKPARLVTRNVSAIILFLAVACFLELGLRTDHLLSDWIPYHRSFWVGAADFVRAGGWLLWDIPSQYGFFSALSLAVWPASSTWQALYEQTAVTLLFDALLIFTLLRYRRSGLLNAAFAITVTAATVYSSQAARFPQGWRLYPQVGLRFTALLGLIGVAFLIFLWRREPLLRNRGYIAGHAIWGLSLLWSFESGIIASFFWWPFVILECVTDFIEGPRRRSELFTTFAARIAPLFILPLVLAGAVELFYCLRLGHGPDWSAYVEFSVAYNRQQVAVHVVLPNGPGWLLVALLIAVGGVAFRAIRMHRWNVVPLIVACWFAIWGVSSYYVAEGFNDHVNSLAPIFATVIAVLLAIQRSEPKLDLVSMPARALFAPILILTLTTSFGSPSEIGSIEAPGRLGFSFDSTAKFPTVTGELQALATAAHVSATDLVIYPVSIYNIKLDLGLTLPFVRTSDGHAVQQLAWLPLTPVGPFSTLMTLPYERRTQYLERFYAQTRRSGWLYSYHQPVDCGKLIPGLITTDVHRSINYQIGRCRKPASGSLTLPSS